MLHHRIILAVVSVLILSATITAASLNTSIPIPRFIDTAEDGKKIQAAPDTPSPQINSTSGLNSTNDDLNCFATITDPDSDPLNVTVQWHKNTNLNQTLYYNNSYPSGTFFISTLSSGNTTAGESWSCSISINDGFLSSASSSGNITIVPADHDPPIIAIYSPQGTTYYANDAANYIINVNYSATDANLDSCWKQFENANTTLPNCENSTITITSEGQKELFIYANDTFGNSGYANVSFKVVQKSPDGAACSEDIECLGGYCVHEICRSAETYCGDGFCDSSETEITCPADCQTSVQNLYSWKGVSSDESLSVKIENDFISEIKLTAEESSKSASFIFLPVLRPGTKPPEGHVYRYFHARTNIKVSEAVVSFKVEKKWARKNNVSKYNIALSRMGKISWEDMETLFQKEDKKYYYYTAKIKGFSLFAIVARSYPVSAPQNKPENKTNETTSKSRPQDEIIKEMECSNTDCEERDPVCPEGETRCIDDLSYICKDGRWIKRGECIRENESVCTSESDGCSEEVSERPALPYASNQYIIAAVIAISIIAALLLSKTFKQKLSQSKTHAFRRKRTTRF